MQNGSCYSSPTFFSGDPELELSHYEKYPDYPTMVLAIHQVRVTLQINSLDGLFEVLLFLV